MREGIGPVVVRSIGECVGASVLWRTHGQLRATFIAKARFQLVHRGPMKLVAPEPFVRADDHVNASLKRSLRRANELVPYRPRADLVFHGHACAPAGHTVQALAVRVAVAGDRPFFAKSLHVYGDRVAPATGAEAPPPAPFARMPIVYERAVRGSGFDANPAGVEQAPGLPMPNVVDPEDPEGPAGFGPIGSQWPLRARLLRDTDPRSLEGEIAELPDAFAWTFFNASPPDQRGSFYRGDEWVALDNLHPEHARLETQLPHARATARIYGVPGAQPFVNLELVADSLAIDGDAGTCTLAWRANVLLESEALVSRLRVVVGVETSEQPLAWPGTPAGQGRSRPVVDDECTRMVPSAELSAAHAAAQAASLRHEEPRYDEQTVVGQPDVIEALAARAGGAGDAVDAVDAGDGNTTLQAPVVGRGGQSAPSLADEAEALSERISTLVGSKAASFKAAALSAFAPQSLEPIAQRDLEPDLESTLQRRSPFAPARATLVSEPMSTGGPPSLPASSVTTPALAKPAVAFPEFDDPETSVQDDGELAALLAQHAQSTDDEPPPTVAPVARPETRAEVEAMLAAGAPLSGLRLVGADLSGLDFTGCALDDADFTRAKLRGAKLSGARAAGARFCFADLTDADAQNADLERADFYGATLTRARFANAGVAGANFATAEGERANFAGARGRGALFGGGRWVLASFVSVALPEADFTEALLDSANFDDAELEAVRFPEARGAGASFRRVTLSRARFDGADFERACFDHVYAPNSAWDEAGLDHASFKGAMLPEASLAKASCRGADFSGAELASAHLQRAKLEGARFVRTDVGGAEFDGADLSNADLRGSNVARESLGEARTDDAKLE